MASVPLQAAQRRRSPPGRSSSELISTSDLPLDRAASTPQGALTRYTDNGDEVSNVSGGSQHTTEVIPRDTSDGAAGESMFIEVRHCWICLLDEGDEGEENIGEWRSPCPCNLQAHEECMLEWIADLEAPNSRKGSPASKILCPQCKAEIMVARPRDLIVSTMGLLNGVGRLLILPAGLSALFGCLYAGSMAYGVNAIYLVCGNDTLLTLIGHRHEPSAMQKLLGDRIYSSMMRTFRYTDPFMPVLGFMNWMIPLGAPLIAPALILSRTSLADHAFAILPITFFAIRPQQHDLRQWPPSPGLAFAVLPYIRTAYNEIYKYWFADLEKQWDRAVLRKPREGETMEQVVQEQNGPDNDQVELQLEIEFGGVRQNQAPIQNDREALPVAEALPPPEQVDPQNDQQEEAQPPDRNGVQDAAAAAAAEQGQPPPRDAGRGQGILQIPTATIATSVMGALFFPAVSSLMGDLLKHTLPKHLTTRAPRGVPASGLLQEKWGRSIVGGCLFVVLKDVAVLYVKWKRAKNQGKRRVVDFAKRETT